MRREQAQAVRGEVARRSGAPPVRNTGATESASTERAGVEELTREVSAADDPYVPSPAAAWMAGSATATGPETIGRPHLPASSTIAS
jgi:hypothetical protein